MNEIYEEAINKARGLMWEKTIENKAPSWLLTTLAQKVGKELSHEFNVNEKIVSITLYLQHIVFDPITKGEIQKNHPNLSAQYVIENKLLEEWNIPKEDRKIIIEAIKNHHNKEKSDSLIVEVIKNAECQKFVTVEGALIWLHELGLRGFDYEKSKELVFYKMNQKKELLTLGKCRCIGEENCKKIEKLFDSEKYILKLKNLHSLGLMKVPFEEAIKKINIDCFSDSTR